MVLLVYFYSYSSISQTTTDWIFSNPNDATQTTGNCPAGTVPAHIISNWGGSSSQSMAFGGCHDIFAISYAINNALANAGTDISVDAIEYTWKWINGCFNVTVPNNPNIWCDTNINDRLDDNFKPTGQYADQFDTLIVTVQVKDSSGTVIEQKIYNYDTWYHWAQANAHSSNEVSEGSAYWQVEQDSISLFNHSNMSGSIYALNQLSTFHVNVEGKDGGYWSGYYGPVIKDGAARFTYRPNPCLTNPLYDASCPGYADAYALQLYNQQCTSNPLYDSGCPGYDTAYFNQQCTANPLYNSGCPGYEDAYLLQQCELNALYNTECTGYAAAYLAQQCALDTLYDSECTGYAAAYLLQQCSLNTLYDKECNGYDIAYSNQQCALDPQYDISCPGYIEPIDETLPEAVLEIDTIITVMTPVITQVIIPEVIIPEVIIPEPIIEVMIEPEIEIIQSIEAEIEAEIQEIEIVMVEEEVKENVDKEIKEDIKDSKEDVSESEKIEEPISEVSNEVEESKDKEVEEESSNNEEVDVGGGTSTGSDDKKVKDDKSNSKPKKLTKKEKIKKLLEDKLKSLAADMGNAASIEQQKQIQAQVLALINFNPDFKNYLGNIPGGNIPGGTYPDKQLKDNTRGLLNSYAQDKLHNEMVNMQWE